MDLFGILMGVLPLTIVIFLCSLAVIIYRNIKKINVGSQLRVTLITSLIVTVAFWFMLSFVQF